MTSTTIKSMIGLSILASTILMLTVIPLGAETEAAEAAAPIQGEAMESQRFQATLVGVRGRASSRSTGITIWLEGTTSDEDLEEYLNLVAEGEARGQNSQLRRRLERVRGLGRIAPTGSTGTDFAIVRKRETPEGDLFTLVTARHLPFIEMRNMGRSLEYPFSYLQMLIDKDGNGQGTVIAAARVFFDDDGVLNVESFGLEPFQLFNLRRR